MISQDRYISITSEVLSAPTVAERDLILRIVTRNPVLTPGVVIECLNAESVGDYFGTNSEEYKRAVKYFNFVSKSTTIPDRISFTRWIDTPIPPMIMGDNSAKDIVNFTAFGSNASLTFVVEGCIDGNGSFTVSVDLTHATSLEDVANSIQTAIRTIKGGDSGSSTVNPNFVQAGVIFKAVTQQFILTGTVAGQGTIYTQVSSGANDISNVLGWSTPSKSLINGQGASTPVQSISDSANLSNNFGSFLFCGEALTVDQIQAVSTWNNDQNNLYMYLVPVISSNYEEIFTAVSNNGGTGLIYYDVTSPNDYSDMAPGMILAATDYSKANASRNYMFYQFADFNITVTKDNLANSLDACRVNYIGATQQAGQVLAFFQRGVLCGKTTDATDMTVYANEMWLKGEMESVLFQLFIDVEGLPATETGIATIKAVLQTVITTALANGTIAIGKTLSTAQRVAIKNATGSDTAYIQIENQGYYLIVAVDSKPNLNSKLQEYFFKYTLIYSKADQIRSIEGTHEFV